MATDFQEIDEVDVSESEPRSESGSYQSAPRSSPKLPPMTVDNANKMIRFFQENPRFLANKYTSQAANNMLGASTKIVGMSIQLERLNARADAARGRNTVAQKVGDSLLKMAESGEVGAGIAAKWYALGDDGKPLYENPANASKIFEDYKTHTATLNGPGDLVGIEIEMPDGSTVQAIRNTQGKGYTVVPRKGDVETAIAKKETGKKISRLETDARELEKKYMSANAEYVEAMTGKKVEGTQQKAIKNKADYFRTQQMEKARQIKALRNPPAATNAPADSAPSGFQEGQRVRSRVTGKFGTVKNGVVVPDPDPAE